MNAKIPRIKVITGGGFREQHFSLLTLVNSILNGMEIYDCVDPADYVRLADNATALGAMRCRAAGAC